MPIYEYQCQSCGHQLEAFQKISEAVLTECPQCHQQTLNKLISAAGFQLKGTGWYVTDYRNKEKNTSSESNAEKKSTETSTTSDSKSTETSSKTTDKSGGSDTTSPGGKGKGTSSGDKSAASS